MLPPPFHTGGRLRVTWGFLNYPSTCDSLLLLLLLDPAQVKETIAHGLLNTGHWPDVGQI